MRHIASAIFILLSVLTLDAQVWIWYPGDMEIWSGNRLNTLRRENGAMWPAFWRNDSHWQTVEFSKTVDLENAEKVALDVEGRYSVKLDQWFVFGMPDTITVPEGRHTIRISVNNVLTPPSIWVDGPTIKSDRSWTVTNFAKPKQADTWTDVSDQPMFASREGRPSAYRLPVRAVIPVDVRQEGRGMFADFGREGMGYLRLDSVVGNGKVRIWYGESPAEARDKEWAYLQDAVVFSPDTVSDLVEEVVTPRKGLSYTLPGSRAMRYVYVEPEDGLQIGSLVMMAEMKDVGEKYRGSFECSDTLINRIWQTSAYTLHLTDREVMIEGIKRDRWMWSGDAIQSYLMNYYSLMDTPAVKRTIRALRGKDPVEQHINTILDYTFYWFNSVYDYYLYTGDAEFVKDIYPEMKTLMDFVEGRLNSRGLVEGMPGDWVFVDWSPGPMSKDGELSFEQMVWLRSLEAMELCAGIAGRDEDCSKYGAMATKLRESLMPLFWNEDRQLFVHAVKDGRQTDEVTRYANIFAVLYGFADAGKHRAILENVLLNDSVMPITTPYMRFYELEALCALGEHRRVLGEMRSYWGGMLKEGATTFWETYDPNESYPERLAMYGHRYGKSLCHAWGASPLYLLGKYFLGVRPLEAGYASWEAEPHLGDLKWMKGDVPAAQGNIHIEMDRKKLTVLAEGTGPGRVILTSRHRPKVEGCVAEPELIEKDRYSLEVKPGRIYKVTF